MPAPLRHQARALNWRRLGKRAWGDLAGGDLVGHSVRLDLLRTCREGGTGGARAERASSGQQPAPATTTAVRDDDQLVSRVIIGQIT